MADQSKGTDDQELIALEKQKQIAELRKAIAEAQKAERDALLPKEQTKALDGTITMDDKTRIQTILLGYHAMQECVAEIYQKVDKKIIQNSKVLLVDTLKLVDGDYPFIQIRQGLSFYEQLFDDQQKMFEQLLATNQSSRDTTNGVSTFVTSTIATALSTGISVANLLSDLASFFQVNYNYKSQEFALNDEALRVNVAGKLGGRGCIFNFRLIDNSDIIIRITNLFHRKAELAYQNALVEKLPENKKSIADAASAAYQKLMVSFDNFMSMVTATPTSDTPSVMLAAIARELIHADTITHLLYLKVMSSGGDIITQQSRWSGPKTVFWGGCAVSYVLADRHGQIVLGDTITKLRHLKYEFDGSQSTLSIVDI